MFKLLGIKKSPKKNRVSSLEMTGVEMQDMSLLEHSTVSTVPPARGVSILSKLSKWKSDGLLQTNRAMNRMDNVADLECIVVENFEHVDVSNILHGIEEALNLNSENRMACEWNACGDNGTQTVYSKGTMPREDSNETLVDFQGIPMGANALEQHVYRDV
jgi:hypothetical protein